MEIVSGIPSEDLPYVFDRSYRVQKDRSSLTGGSGLGLAIVRSVVELHGGEVSVDNQLDRVRVHPLSKRIC